MKNLIICLIIATALFSQNVLAQKAGLLDSTFNSNGINVTPDTSGDAQNFAMAIQPADGKTVTAGYATDDSGLIEMAVTRYNINGTLDNTFNGTGIFTKLIGKAHCEANAIAIQPDAKIIVGGFIDAITIYDFLLVRLNANGSIDSTFGLNGIVATDFNNHKDAIEAIAIQQDGKIVVAGSANNGSHDNFALARYNVNGTLDNGFGTGGKATASIGTGDNGAYALVIQADGKIIAGGYSVSNYSNFTLVRYTTNGTPDSTFGTNGIAITDASGYASSGIYALRLQPNGKILAGGFGNNDSDDDFAIARYNVSGTLDSSFGTNGVTVTDFSSSGDYVYSVMIQPDSKIVAAGFTYAAPVYSFALARYKSNGSLDSAFGSNGLVTTDVNGSDDDIYSGALQADGKIVVAGTSSVSNTYQFAVARYLTGLNTGILDFSTPVNSYLIYPNPVKQNAHLEYELANAETISVQVMDISGKLISRIINGENQTAGKHELNIPFSNQLASGTYLVRIISANGQVGIKMIKE